MTIALYTLQYFLALMIAKKPKEALSRIASRMRDFAKSEWVYVDVLLLIAFLIYDVARPLATIMWILCAVMGCCLILKDINKKKGFSE